MKAIAMKQPVLFRYLPLNAPFEHPGMEGEYIKSEDDVATLGNMNLCFMPGEFVIADFPPISTCKDAPPAEPDLMHYFQDGEIDYEAYDMACVSHYADLQDWWSSAGRKFIEIEMTWQQRERQMAAA